MTGNVPFLTTLRRSAPSHEVISEDTKEHHQEFQGDLNITKTVLKFQAIEYV